MPDLLLAAALIAQSYRLEGLDVRGVVKVKPELVAHVLNVSRGADYGPGDIEARLAALIGTGLFESVTITMKPNPADTGAGRLLVEVTEWTRAVPPAGMAHLLNPPALIRAMTLDIEPAPVDVSPEDFLGLWTRVPFPSPRWPAAYRHGPSIRRLRRLESRPVTPLTAARIAHELRDALQRGDTSVAPSTVVTALARLDGRVRALSPGALKGREPAYLAYYAALRAELLTVVDPDFGDTVMARRAAFWGPALDVLRGRAGLDPGDTALAAALAIQEVMASAYCRAMDEFIPGRDHFQTRTLRPVDRAAFLAALDTNPTTLHVLQRFPGFLRARLTAAAYLGETVPIAEALMSERDLEWGDPAIPGFLLVFARAVFNNSRHPERRLPGFSTTDRLVVGAEHVAWMAGRGGVAPRGEAAEALALILSEAPREHDIDTWLSRGADGFYAWYTRGRMALRLGRPRAAVEAFSEALARRDDRRARYLRAIAFLAAGVRLAAEDDFAILRRAGFGRN